MRVEEEGGEKDRWGGGLWGEVLYSFYIPSLWSHLWLQEVNVISWSVGLKGSASLPQDFLLTWSSSCAAPFPCEVPQGSVLGPLTLTGQLRSCFWSWLEPEAETEIRNEQSPDKDRCCWSLLTHSVSLITQWKCRGGADASRKEQGIYQRSVPTEASSGDRVPQSALIYTRPRSVCSRVFVHLRTDARRLSARGRRSRKLPDCSNHAGTPGNVDSPPSSRSGSERLGWGALEEPRFTSGGPVRPRRRDSGVKAPPSRWIRAGIALTFDPLRRCPS